MENKGILYIIGTPIGNLEDITLRAIRTLQEVDIILAEDTRQTLKLLNHLNIKKSLISYHRHNEVEKIEEIIKLLDKKMKVGLVSDAGMPIISDPGQELVKTLVARKYNIEVIPGVTAVITGLVKSGLDSTSFIFEGFLSINKRLRKEKLESLKNETKTVVFYEAPHKILKTLNDMYSILGNRKICIARELTKIYEEYITDDISNIIARIEEKGIKGEIVLIVEGIDKDKLDKEKKEMLKSKSNIDLVKELIKSGIDKKEAIKQVAKLKKISKNDVYKDCLDI